MANTEQQQELGAQALLELTKQKNEKSNLINNTNTTNNNTSNDEINFDQHKDVEAEVMRLVGSALNPDDKSNHHHHHTHNQNNIHNQNNSNKKLLNSANINKKRPFSDDDISQLEFQQWTTGFLGEEEDEDVEAEVEAHVNEYNFQQQQQEQEQQNHQHQQQHQPDQQIHEQQEQQVQQQQKEEQQQEHSQSHQSSPQKIKRQKKLSKDNNHQHHDLKSSLNVDPELAQLDTNPFVDDDMIDARTLESLGHIDHEYLRQAAESHRDDDDVERLAVQAAAQAVAAAQAQAQSHSHSHPQSQSPQQQVVQTSQDQDQTQEQAQAQVVAAAAEAAAAVVADVKHDNNVDQHQHQHQHTQDNELDDSSIVNQRKHDGRANKILADPSETASLIAEAAAKASSWISANMHSKSFSKEEADAIDSFILEYCHINKMSREDICRRIWANERRKDDFWECIQKVLPLRTRASVYKHVRRTYHVFDVRGKWTKEDDLKLAELATEKEGQWKAIGLEMNRMPEDCRDRWRNYVKCGNNRQQNKWSIEEEDLLKQVVYEMVKNSIKEEKENKQENGGNADNGNGNTTNNDDFEITKDNVITYATTNEPIINWTIVSEKLGGMRSRIQCRYKWNKLLRREAIERSKSMTNEDKLWIVSRIKDFQFEDSSSIDWNSIVSLQPNNYFTVLDLKVAFEKLKSSQRDHRRLPFHQTLDIIINQLNNESNQPQSQQQSPPPPPQTSTSTSQQSQSTQQQQPPQQDTHKSDDDSMIQELGDMIKNETKKV